VKKLFLQLVHYLKELNALLSNIIALILRKAKKLEVELAANKRKEKDEQNRKL